MKNGTKLVCRFDGEDLVIYRCFMKNKKCKYMDSSLILDYAVYEYKSYKKIYDNIIEILEYRE